MLTARIVNNLYIYSKVHVSFLCASFKPNNIYIPNIIQEYVYKQLWISKIYHNFQEISEDHRICLTWHLRLLLTGSPLDGGLSVWIYRNFPSANHEMCDAQLLVCEQDSGEGEKHSASEISRRARKKIFGTALALDPTRLACPIPQYPVPRLSCRWSWGCINFAFHFYSGNQSSVVLCNDFQFL